MANYSKNQQDKASRGLYPKSNKRRLRLEDVIRCRGVVEGLERSGREVRQRQKKSYLMKTTCSRARQLEITVSLYSLSKGSRAIYCSEKIPRSRIRGVGSGSQVIGKGAVSSFHSYYLWEFGSFLCFFSFVVLLLCNPNKILQGTEGTRILFPPIISPSVALELKGYLSDLRFSFVLAL